MKKPLLAILTTAICFVPLKAIASVIEIPREVAARGERQVILWSDGGGLQLDFSQLNERIQEINLADMSRIGFYHCHMTNSCGENPSPYIQLKRINEIKFPGTPQTETTVLTVSTVNSKGRWNSYQFPITLVTGKAQYTKAVIGNMPALTPQPSAVKHIQSVPTSKPSSPSIEQAVQSSDVDRSEELQLLKDIKVLLEEMSQQPTALETIPDVENEPQNDSVLIEVETILSTSKIDPELKINLSSEKADATLSASKDKPESQTNPLPAKTVTALLVPTHIKFANAIAKGMVVDPVRPGGWEWSAINSAIRILRRGGSLTSAASRSGLSEDRLRVLMALGGHGVD